MVIFSGIEKSWLELLRTYRFNGKDNGQYNAAEAVVTLEDLKVEKTLEDLKVVKTLENLEAEKTLEDLRAVKILEDLEQW